MRIDASMKRLPAELVSDLSFICTFYCAIDVLLRRLVNGWERQAEANDTCARQDEKRFNFGGGVAISYVLFTTI